MHRMALTWMDMLRIVGIVFFASNSIELEANCMELHFITHVYVFSNDLRSGLELFTTFALQPLGICLWGQNGNIISMDSRTLTSRDASERYHVLIFPPRVKIHASRSSP